MGYTMVLAVALAWLAGCQTTRAPRAEVRSVAVTEQTAEGARIEVVVQVHNPNDVALPVRSAAYDVTVDQAGTFTFTDQPPVTLPPRGEQTITLPAAFVRSDEPLVGRPVRVAGRLRYQPPGEIRQLMTDYWIPLPSLSFDRQATLDTFVDE
ncbi:MAG: LEA type 2 family protein [Phycisphaeraceae bacterium]